MWWGGLDGPLHRLLRSWLLPVGLSGGLLRRCLTEV
jgi:hypothetical protein